MTLYQHLLLHRDRGDRGNKAKPRRNCTKIFTALGCAITYSRRHIYPILLAAGATFPPVDTALCPQAWTSRIDDALTHDPYLQKIRAVGFPAYERTHRQALATKFAAKAFPRLPTDVAGQVVAFAFHVGYY